MTGNLSEKGQKSAAIKAEKRAAALRENLKRRKIAASGDQKGNDENAKPENSE